VVPSSKSPQDGSTQTFPHAFSEFVRKSGWNYNFPVWQILLVEFAGNRLTSGWRAFAPAELAATLSTAWHCGRQFARLLEL
jgi:hypothetical protein